MQAFFSRVLGKDAVGLYIGATTRKKRIQIQEDFNAGKIKILIASSAGTRGIDLPNGKSVINYDLPWHEAVMVQRNRITRIVASGEKRIFVLVLKNSLDAYVYQIVRDKAVQATVLDEGAATMIKSRSQSWSSYLRRLLDAKTSNA
jgi:superfamily II DNA/RNA helicase